MPKPPETEMLFEVELAVRCEKLEATNKELLDALELTISKYSETLNHQFGIGFYDTEESREVEKAITNAKQVMGDK